MVEARLLVGFIQKRFHLRLGGVFARPYHLDGYCTLRVQLPRLINDTLAAFSHPADQFKISR